MVMTAISADQFAKLEERGLAVLAQGESVRFDVVQGESFSIGAAGEPAAVISITQPDLMDLLEGNVSVLMCMLRNRLGMTGDKLLARRLLAKVAGEVFMPPPPRPSGDLPAVTSDIQRAQADLRDWGYCLIDKALDPEQVAALRQDLIEESEFERAAGYACLDGDPNAPPGKEPPSQRLYYIINKSPRQRDLLVHPLVDELLTPVLGAHFHTFAFTAIISGPGGQAQTLHYDQLWVQPPVPYAVFYNIGWYLDDVTEENGATRIIPGSHLWGPGTGPIDVRDTSITIPATGPAGTMIVFDGRLWHGGGANVSNGRRHVLFTPMCKPFIRPQDNYFLLLDPAVEETLSPLQKERLGFRVTSLLGTVGPPIDGRIVGRGQPRVSPAEMAKEVQRQMETSAG